MVTANAVIEIETNDRIEMIGKGQRIEIVVPVKEIDEAPADLPDVVIEDQVRAVARECVVQAVVGRSGMASVAMVNVVAMKLIGNGRNEMVHHIAAKRIGITGRAEEVAAMRTATQVVVAKCSVR